MTLGIILGGRIGYVLFYNLPHLRRASAGDPRTVERRHVVPRRLHRLRRRGGAVRAAAAAFRSCRSATSPARSGRSACSSAASPTSSTANCGAARPTCRGRWSFPSGGPMPRHPSQLYEAALEGLVLLLVLALLIRARRAEAAGPDHRRLRGRSTRARASFCEFFREPDAQLGFLWGGADHGHAAVDPAVPRRPRASSSMRCSARRAQTADGPTPLEAEIRAAHRGRTGRCRSPSTWRCASPHPQHGYYVTRDPLGARGDFITAPEISQMFGELIGLWMAAVWQQMGAPATVRLVELGPGRGTLMADALRAAEGRAGIPRRRRACIWSRSARRCRRSSEQTLRERRRRRSTGTPRSTTCPTGRRSSSPTNSSTRCRCIQAVKHADGWHERVRRDRRRRTISPSRSRATPIADFERRCRAAVRDAPDGAIFEWRADDLALELGAARRRDGGAALVIDYGHAASAIGDTLQAVARPRLRRSAGSAGRARPHRACRFRRRSARAAEHRRRARPSGRSTQGEFLRRLGIDARAAALKAKASPRQGRRHRRGAGAADRHRPQRDGRAVQGAGARRIRSFGARCRGLPTAWSRLLCSCRCVASHLIMARHGSQPHSLSRLPRIRHGFFTREGGVSDGVYASLNGGIGSNDAPDKVAENRARMAAALGVAPDHLLTAYQIHSPDVVVAEQPWTHETRPRADAIVTRTPRARASASRPPTAGRCCSPTREARRDRRRACRLARRVHRRDRGDHRGDGKARRRARRASPPRSGR